MAGDREFAGWEKRGTHATSNFPWQFALSCSQVTVAAIDCHRLSVFWKPGSPGMLRKDGVSEMPGVLPLLCCYPPAWSSASNFSWLCVYPISEIKVMILFSLLSALKPTVDKQSIYYQILMLHHNFHSLTCCWLQCWGQKHCTARPQPSPCPPNHCVTYLCSAATCYNGKHVLTATALDFSTFLCSNSCRAVLLIVPAEFNVHMGAPLHGK